MYMRLPILILRIMARFFFLYGLIIMLCGCASISYVDPDTGAMFEYSRSFNQKINGLTVIKEHPDGRKTTVQLESQSSENEKYLTTVFSAMFKAMNPGP